MASNEDLGTLAPPAAFFIATFCCASRHNRLQFGPAVESFIDAFADRLGVPDTPSPSA